MAYQAPKSMPKSLHMGNQQLSQKGVGRGIGRGSTPVQTPQRPGISKQNPSLVSAINTAQKPVKAYEGEAKSSQQYIPGLTSAPSNVPNYGPVAPYTEKTNAAKDVPSELIEEFMTNKKNPISAIMEYAAITKLTASFREVAVENYSMFAKFACVCDINGREYPQGTGKTKKEAKTNAAKIAFNSLLGLDEENIPTENHPGNVYQGIAYQAEELAKQIKKQDGTATSTEMLTKHPVSLLQEYCQKRKMEVSFDTSMEKGPYGFESICYIDDQEMSRAYAQNKKDSKMKAAEAAMKMVLAKDQPTAITENMTHYDKMAALSLRKYNSLLKDNPDYLPGRKILAAFIVKRGQEDDGDVVALGTGSTCIGGDCLSEDGRILFDSHAEVVAKRAFLKYLHAQLKMAYNTGSDEQMSLSIFERNLETGICRLKNFVSIHLYISHSPCGDASCFTAKEQISQIMSSDEMELILQGVHYPSFATPNFGLLRTKIEQDPQTNPSGEGTQAVKNNSNTIQTLDGIKSGVKLRTMSCSDKILKWNLCGLQGALLSHFTEPVYLSSLTLGYQFDHEHLCRAVCCRLDDSVNHSLPYNYRLRHPYLGRVSLYETSRDTGKLSTHSINWCETDDKIEIIDGQTGKSSERSPFRTTKVAHAPSRLCKAAFLHRFRELAKLVRFGHLATIERYSEVKAAAADYQNTKRLLYQILEQKNYGRWIKKPEEVEMFMK